MVLFITDFCKEGDSYVGSFSDGSQVIFSNSCYIPNKVMFTYLSPDYVSGAKEDYPCRFYFDQDLVKWDKKLIKGIMAKISSNGVRYDERQAVQEIKKWQKEEERIK